MGRVRLRGSYDYVYFLWLYVGTGLPSGLDTDLPFFKFILFMKTNHRLAKTTYDLESHHDVIRFYSRAQ